MRVGSICLDFTLKQKGVPEFPAEKNPGIDRKIWMSQWVD